MVKNNGFGLLTLLLLILILSTCGCSDKANSFTALNRPIDYGNNGYDSVYAIPVQAGDVLNIEASTDNDADFVCITPSGFDLLIQGTAEQKESQMSNYIVDSYTKQDTDSYEQSITCDQDGFFCLAVVPSSGEDSISGNIQVTRLSDSDKVLTPGFSATEFVQKYSSSQNSQSSSTGYSQSSSSSASYTSNYPIGGASALADKMKKEAEEAQDTADRWKEERLEDDMTYFQSSEDDD